MSLHCFLGLLGECDKGCYRSSYEFLLFHSVADACLCRTVELQDIFTYFNLLHYTRESIRRFLRGSFWFLVGNELCWRIRLRFWCLVNNCSSLLSPVYGHYFPPVCTTEGGLLKESETWDTYKMLVAHTLNPMRRRIKQDCPVFKANTGYKVSLRPAWTTKEDHISCKIPSKTREKYANTIW